MFSADCYLSVISAFLSVMTAEMSKGEEVERRRERERRKTSGQQSSVPQTGNGSLRMPQLLCLALLLLQSNQSSRNSSYDNFFKCQALKIVRLH